MAQSQDYREPVSRETLGKRPLTEKGRRDLTSRVKFCEGLRNTNKSLRWFSQPFSPGSRQVWVGTGNRKTGPSI